MSESMRYCSTCGALLTADAVLCGECGARYRPAPYDRRPTAAPGAWGPPPQRRRARAAEVAASTAEPPRVELLTRPSSASPPGDSAAPSVGGPQYDRPMVMPAPSSAAPWSSPAPAAVEPRRGLDAPLDGCVPAGIPARLAAWLLDAVVLGVLTVPLLIGLVLIVVQDGAGILAQVLVGLGVVLVAAAAIAMVWLEGARALTPGQAALGLRTVRARTGRPLGFGRALGREVLRSIPLVGLVMVIPMLFDAHTRRGLHDAAVDAIVLSVRHGRNPLLGRPDDYARQGADHYLPGAPVPVAAHANLMAQPGAPWGLSEPEAGAMWDQPLSTTGQSGIIERSPWAPPTAAPTPGPPPAGPAPAGPAPVAPAAAPTDPAPVSAGLEDLDRTRVTASRLPRVSLRLDDAEPVVAVAPVLVGRNPAPDPDDPRLSVAALADPSRSISKTHLRLDVHGGELTVTDLGSTNGTTHLGENGARTELTTSEPFTVPAPGRFAIGDRTLTVEVLP